MELYVLNVACKLHVYAIQGTESSDLFLYGDGENEMERYLLFTYESDRGLTSTYLISWIYFGH